MPRCDICHREMKPHNHPETGVQTGWMCLNCQIIVPPNKLERKLVTPPKPDPGTEDLSL